MARIVLVRHVESEANKAGVGLGRTDSPPTDLGRQQADLLAAALAGWPVTRVVSSPLMRAALPAQRIAERHGLDVELSDALVELDVGELEGLEWPEARRRYGDFLERWRGLGSHRVAMPGGESLETVQARAWPYVDEVARSLPDQGCAVVVSHNFVLRALICAAIRLDLAHWRSVAMELASCSTLLLDGPIYVLEGLNDRTHLLAEGAPP